MTDHDPRARRSFLTALASLGLAATGTAGRLDALAQVTAPVRPHRIDVHHHFAPPAWVVEVKGRPLLQSANTTWTPARSIEDMDRGGVAAAVVSITNPGVWFGDPAVTRRLARACNDYGATLVQQYPTRFGVFAAMPLPDVDATLKEIAYAYDVLKADGVGLMTSYGDTWLGNAAYRPVMEELNRRKAVVHVHPTAANCCRNLEYAPGVGPGSLEYGTDTTRAIMGVTFSGDVTRYPDIRFIWSHAGGTVPFLAARIDGASRNAADRLPNGFMHEPLLTSMVLREPLLRERLQIRDDPGDAFVGKLSHRDRRHLACTLAHNSEGLLVFASERHESWARVASSLRTVAHFAHAIELHLAGVFRVLPLRRRRRFLTLVLRDGRNNDGGRRHPEQRREQKDADEPGHPAPWR